MLVSWYEIELTVCVQPVIPLSLKGYEDVSCHICNFQQPLEHRPDVQAMKGGGGGGGGGMMMHPPPGAPQQGWQGQEQGQGPGQNPQMRYG
jgi:hypothetical protein